MQTQLGLYLLNCVDYGLSRCQNSTFFLSIMGFKGQLKTPPMIIFSITSKVKGNQFMLTKRAGSPLRSTLRIIKRPFVSITDSSAIQSKLFIINIAPPHALLAPGEQKRVAPHCFLQKT